MTAKKALKSETETGLDVGIGVTNPSEKLVVKGNVLAAKYITDDINNIADYVFEKTYKLRSLNEVESFIKVNKHLPNFKSEKEYKKSGKIDMTEFQKILQEVVEEHTLYIIELKKQIDIQNKEITELKKEIRQLNKKN